MRGSESCTMACSKSSLKCLQRKDANMKWKSKYEMDNGLLKILLEVPANSCHQHHSLLSTLNDGRTNVWLTIQYLRRRSFARCYLQTQTNKQTSKTNNKLNEQTYKQNLWLTIQSLRKRSYAGCCPQTGRWTSRCCDGWTEEAPIKVSESYCIFFISNFTQAGFFNPNILHPKLWKTPKNYTKKPQKM